MTGQDIGQISRGHKSPGTLVDTTELSFAIYIHGFRIISSLILSWFITNDIINGLTWLDIVVKKNLSLLKLYIGKGRMLIPEITFVFNWKSDA